MLMVLLNFYFNDISTILFHSTCKHITDKHIITRSMTKISRAQVTQDVTMGNPSKGKTHQEKSFLYNEEYKYKRYRAIIYSDLPPTINAESTPLNQVSHQEYMPLSQWPHQMNIYGNSLLQNSSPKLGNQEQKP